MFFLRRWPFEISYPRMKGIWIFSSFFLFVGVLLQGQITEIHSHKDGWPHGFAFENCMKHLYQSFSFFHFSSWRLDLNSLGVLLPWICFASGDLFCCFFFAVSFWSALSTEKRNWWLWTADWSGYPFFRFSFFLWSVVGFVFVSSASLSSPSNIEYTIIAREPGEWVNVFFMCFSVFFLLVCICLCTTFFFLSVWTNLWVAFSVLNMRKPVKIGHDCDVESEFIGFI